MLFRSFDHGFQRGGWASLQPIDMIRAMTSRVDRFWYPRFSYSHIATSVFQLKISQPLPLTCTGILVNRVRRSCLGTTTWVCYFLRTGAESEPRIICCIIVKTKENQAAYLRDIAVGLTIMSNWLRTRRVLGATCRSAFLWLGLFSDKTYAERYCIIDFYPSILLIKYPEFPPA